MPTEGPWYYVPNRHRYPDHCTIVDAEGFLIAEITALENSTAHSSLEDNVRLMCKAPAMLEAFNEIVALAYDKGLDQEDLSRIITKALFYVDPERNLKERTLE